MFAVIVPAYNKEKEIVAAVLRLIEVLDSMEIDFKVIVVDDASTDETLSRLSEFSHNPRIEIISNAVNMGKGGALKVGFASALQNGLIQNLGYIDADLDLHPDSIPAMYEMLVGGATDVVIGSKMHPMSQVKYPKSRKLMSRTYSRITRMIIDLAVTDSQTGLKVFSREALSKSMKYVKSSGFSFDLELLTVASQAGYRISEAPVQVDFQFSSSLGVKNSIYAMIELLQIANRSRAYDFGKDRLGVINGKK